MHPQGRIGSGRADGRMWVALAVVLAAARPAAAGHAIGVKVTDHTAGSAVTCRTRLLLSGSRLKVDTSPFTGDASTLYYAAYKDTVWQARHSDRTYVEINSRTVAGMGESLRSAYDRLSGREPEPEPDLDVRATAKTAKIGGLPCRRFEVRAGGRLLQEVWAATWRAADIDAAAFATVRQLALSYERIMSALGETPTLRGMSRIPVAGIARIDGYPVLIRHFEGGRLAFELQLDAPAQQPIDPATLDPPAGYRRVLF